MATKTPLPRINVHPPKRFFVEMLTRDIELEDAILDLVDNCVDGAVRMNAAKRTRPAVESVYAGYKAEITLSKDAFVIKDNCGGIPPDVAKDYAFQFGRPRADIDTDLQTVGVYGIGMKRALFKLGTDSEVVSHHAEGAFSVHIDRAWLTSDDWELEMGAVPAQKSHGLTITVTDLHPAISNRFNVAASGFVDALSRKIRDHYAYIIQKGFQVVLNGTRIEPNLIQTLVATQNRKNAGAIAPYIYETEHDGVRISLVMGMYAPFPTDSELEDLYEGRRSRDTAGWTIICNDRVVLSHDTTHRTGWGEAGVPSYHSQFVMLSGIVEFNSNDASKLPVITTKRGVNLDSPLYASIKDVMREALKHFTSFTYHWKATSDERSEVQSKAQPIDIRAAATSVPASAWQEVRKNLKGRRFVPELPKPAVVKTHARVAFDAPLRGLETVRLFFELEEGSKPSQVGEAAFKWTLEQAK